MPEYTVSLLIWILPLTFLGIALHRRRVLGALQRRAMVVSTSFPTAIAFLLDLVFAKSFFRFPRPEQRLGWELAGVPVEEFIFYVSGLWFVITFYVFCDEVFLSRYNRPDHDYHRFARRLRRRLYLSVWRRGGAYALVASAVVLTLARLNDPPTFPGYALFLISFAYVPYLLFWRMTRRFLNVPALTLVVVTTTLASIIWEVTLALPRGYWNYNPAFLVGPRIAVWADLPVEAVTVWGMSSLTILIYEYVKIISGGHRTFPALRHSHR